MGLHVSVADSVPASIFWAHVAQTGNSTVCIIFLERPPDNKLSDIYMGNGGEASHASPPRNTKN